MQWGHFASGPPVAAQIAMLGRLHRIADVSTETPSALLGITHGLQERPKLLHLLITNSDDALKLLDTFPRPPGSADCDRPPTCRS